MLLIISSCGIILASIQDEADRRVSILTYLHFRRRRRRRRRLPELLGRRRELSRWAQWSCTTSRRDCRGTRCLSARGGPWRFTRPRGAVVLAFYLSTHIGGRHVRRRIRIQRVLNERRYVCTWGGCRVIRGRGGQPRWLLLAVRQQIQNARQLWGEERHGRI